MATKSYLPGFGTEVQQVVYKNWLDWFVRINDCEALRKAQPTYLISQAIFMLAGITTLLHAFKKGGRWPLFWLTVTLHGIFSDNIWSLILPEMDNFWHSQTPIMFFGGRLPLHIIFLYPTFIYTAAYAISRLNLPLWAEPCAVGLTTVLIDIPYDIIAVKFLHWTWHDTDPNIGDRHYWVPWNSYFFHASFASSCYFFFHIVRRLCDNKAPKWGYTSFGKEIKAVIAGSLLGMPGGVVIFTTLYHPLHDLYGLHTEVIVFTLFSIYFAVTLSGLSTIRENIKQRLTKMDYLLIVILAAHYLSYWSFSIWGYPEQEVSIGFHEPVGPCDKLASMTTPLGLTVYKRKFLCVKDYDEGYFDFSCLGGKLPSDGSIWYTACGVAFRNRIEYITILSAILVVASTVFYNAFFRNIAPDQPATGNQQKQKKKKYA